MMQMRLKTFIALGAFALFCGAMALWKEFLFFPFGVLAIFITIILIFIKIEGDR